MLGRVFENLLASYNPETKDTARKNTGSYYTPREIVNYMTITTLIEHFACKYANLKGKLEHLFYNENNKHSVLKKY